PAMRDRVEQAGDGRWLAFRLDRKLPVDTQVAVTVGPNIPSAEGPLQTKFPYGFSFRTYGQFKVEDHSCRSDQDCRPLSPWSIFFTNSVDPEAFVPSQVSVDPQVADLKVEANGRYLSIRGQTKGRTTYTVRLKADLKDEYGQTLGREQTLTFKVGSSFPLLTAPGGNFVVLEPGAKPAYSVFTINHNRLKVRLYSVNAADFQAAKEYMAEYGDKPLNPPPGRLIVDKVIEVKGEPDQLVETGIDLTPVLKNGRGQVFVIVEPEGKGVQKINRHFRHAPIVKSWVQVTAMGLDAWADHSDLIVWTNSLKDGSPLSGVEVALWPNGPKAISGNDGLARLPLPDKATAHLLVAKHDQDSAILRANNSWWENDGWHRQKVSDQLRWYVFDDRKMYRPGEEVRIKGWVRRWGGSSKGDISLPPGEARRLSYHFYDSRKVELASGQTTLGGLSGFDLTIKIPDKVNLGAAQLSLVNEGGPADIEERTYNHSFEIQEFRRPEYEVKAGIAEGPYLVGGGTDLTVTAAYYAGGGLPDAEVKWLVSANPGFFTPPGWDLFTFGESRFNYYYDYKGSESQHEEPKELTGRTDSAGAHHLHLDFQAANPPRPYAVQAEATVMDVNRQAWTATQHLLVHPAKLYVGLKTARSFVQPGQPLPVQIITTDLDGRPIPDQPINLHAVRVGWGIQKGRWIQEETVETSAALTSSEQPINKEFIFKSGGMYRMTATIKDAQGRPNRTDINFWVSGGPRPPARKIEKEKMTLIPDKTEYHPGQTAEILVEAPFWPAEALVTLRRSGLVDHQRLSISGPSFTIKVPIVESYIPNLLVQVDLVGAAARSDDQGRVDEEQPKRPAYASGSIGLSVPPQARRLTLEVAPAEKKLDPGAKTSVEVAVTDATGRPLPKAEVAIVVVDEAILALTGYQLTNPMDVFYLERTADVSDFHSRQDLLLIDPQKLQDAAKQAEDEMVRSSMKMARVMSEEGAAPPMPAPMVQSAGAPGGGESKPQPIKMRADFRALAVFAPSVPTDDQGRAKITFTIPDSLTRYRVMAVAVAGEKQFGLGESSITARLPLMVRPSPPRFLNTGDALELPIAVQNQTDKPMDVRIALRAANLDLTAGQGRVVNVPANDRVEVRFPAGTRRPGQVVLQVGAASDPYADAAEVKFPVYTPATAEAFAVYGELDQGAIAQPVTAPTKVFPEFGGLEITTSSTSLQALTDAVLYLTAYPFECSEQLASRVLSVAALKDVLAAFKAEGLPAEAEMIKAVQRDIDRLKGMQNSTGGFPIWRRGEESWPYHSIHAAHALFRAKEKGFVVPEYMLSQANNYLRQIDRFYPSYYNEDIRRIISSYALYVRTLMGDRDVPAARK
ncbi:MAG: hypothetical protein HQK55_11005, partial [Deltaproteobacteria bacterium]|nr:hypothetical protein [Deltaproteobacteria bacterium]